MRGSNVSICVYSLCVKWVGVCVCNKRGEGNNLWSKRRLIVSRSLSKNVVALRGADRLQMISADMREDIRRA